MPDRVGQRIGNYQLTRLLGHGGFADVYLGEHIHLSTQAAIKLLDTHLVHDEIEPFRREARTIAHLEHPHIVRVLDFGVEEHTPFLVMSYAQHGSLRQRHARGTCVAPASVLAYIRQVASALQYAHNEKLVHRDIKPENMLLGRNDEILLSDFGLAVVASSSAHQGVRDVSGTIAYMAPEQARGRPQPASDQYSLAVVVYEWLCGERPFSGTYEEIAIQHALAQPPSLCQKVPMISLALEAVLMKALTKDPRQRFASVQDFAEALEQAYQAGPETTTMALPPPVTASARQETSYSTDRVAADTIYVVAWSPDKRRIAYGGHDKTVQVRGATTGVSAFVYHGHNGGVTTLAWSPDGQYIASASLDRTIQVWNASTGHRLATYTGHSGIIYALAWSPDGRQLASTSGSADSAHIVHLWEASSGRTLLAYRGHSYWVRSIAWSPDGKHIASGSWREVQVWDVHAAVEHKLFTYRGHTSWVRSVTWSPDGRRLASAGEDETVQLWEPVGKGRAYILYRGHSDWVSSVVWSPDGKHIASAGKDNTIHVWNADNASNVFSHQFQSSSTYAIAWLPDNKHIVYAGGDGAIHVWQAI